MLELAKKYFGIKEEPNFHVANRDGRLFLQESKDHYDIILIDAYRGPFVPFHLLTKEFYQLVKDHLAEGGVVAQNVEPSTMLFDSAVKTITPCSRSWISTRPTATSSRSPIAGDGAQAGGSAPASPRQRDKALGLRYSLTDMLAERRPHRHRWRPGDRCQRQGADRRLRPGRVPEEHRASQQETAVSAPVACPRVHAVAIYLCAFIVGCVLMGFEMLGSRYLFPYFGGGIGTWASLISTVLCALAIGYFAGSALVDRQLSPRTHRLMILIAAAYLAIVPASADPVMSAILETIGDGACGARCWPRPHCCWCR